MLYRLTDRPSGPIDIAVESEFSGTTVLINEAYDRCTIEVVLPVSHVNTSEKFVSKISASTNVECTKGWVPHLAIQVNKVVRLAKHITMAIRSDKWLKGAQEVYSKAEEQIRIGHMHSECRDLAYRCLSMIRIVLPIYTKYVKSLDQRRVKKGPLRTIEEVFQAYADTYYKEIEYVHLNYYSKFINTCFDRVVGYHISASDISILAETDLGDIYSCTHKISLVECTGYDALYETHMGGKIVHRFVPRLPKLNIVTERHRRKVSDFIALSKMYDSNVWVDSKKLKRVERMVKERYEDLDKHTIQVLKVIEHAFPCRHSQHAFIDNMTAWEVRLMRPFKENSIPEVWVIHKSGKYTLPRVSMHLGDPYDLDKPLRVYLNLITHESALIEVYPYIEWDILKDARLAVSYSKCKRLLDKCKSLLAEFTNEGRIPSFDMYGAYHIQDLTVTVPYDNVTRHAALVINGIVMDIYMKYILKQKVDDWDIIYKDYIGSMLKGMSNGTHTVYSYFLVKGRLKAIRIHRVPGLKHISEAGKMSKVYLDNLTTIREKQDKIGMPYITCVTLEYISWLSSKMLSTFKLAQVDKIYVNRIAEKLIG